MKIRYIDILLLLVFLIMVACNSGQLIWEDEHPDPFYKGDRRMVEWSGTLSLEPEITRISYTPTEDNNHKFALHLTWDVNETLGVYYNKEYAGKITSLNNAQQRGMRTFSGVVAEKTDPSKKYSYFHPYIGGNADINFAQQSGSLRSESHLKNLVPNVWANESTDNSIRGYAIRCVLSFSVNPGAIRSITLQSTHNVFASSFEVASMGVKNWTNSITLMVTGENLPIEDNGSWVAETYIVSSVSSIKSDAELYEATFYVQVEAENGTYICDPEYFPRESGDDHSKYKPFENGVCYTLARNMTLQP